MADSSRRSFLHFRQHRHGGQLQSASHHYNIPLEDWLDLSTGISPYVYPLPSVPMECWQRLPEANDALAIEASRYYGSDSLLPVAGSQEAIQCLPLLFPKRQRVGIIKPAYHSHQQAWENAGHQMVTLKTSEVEQQLPSLDVLIIVNPTNPSTESFKTDVILSWHQQIIKNNGCLIVDEAFIDTTPEGSVINQQPKQGLIVLRSIGKFFGLAGIRLGFVWATGNVLEQLANRQDDWSVSHPARWAGGMALRDKVWQEEQRKRLNINSQRLQVLLSASFESKVFSTALFAYLRHDKSEYYYHQLAKKGILVRLFIDPLALRFGLPANDQQWLYLEKALKSILP